MGRAYGEAPTMIGARSQPRLRKTSTTSTHMSWCVLHALRGMHILCHSGGDAMPDFSTPTRQSSDQSRAAAAQGIQLPWPGAALRGGAGERGRLGSPWPQR